MTSLTAVASRTLYFSVVIHTARTVLSHQFYRSDYGRSGRSDFERDGRNVDSFDNDRLGDRLGDRLDDRLGGRL
tara:strand:+ start:2350 stop:2571 length:222 start_codon:yes stop_codon:yes gene_type:complete